MYSPYAPVVRVLVVGAVIFALLAIGAATTYRLAWATAAADNERHVNAVLLGAKVYAGVAMAMLGSAMVVGGMAL